MNPAAALQDPPTEPAPVAEEEVASHPMMEEARAPAEWYASEEFDRQLLAVFEQARQVAIASNPPRPAK